MRGRTVVAGEDFHLEVVRIHNTGGVVGALGEDLEAIVADGRLGDRDLALDREGGRLTSTHHNGNLRA